MEEDIELFDEKKKEAIKILKSTPFEKLEVIEEHYFNKFGAPRHGVKLEKAKEIYAQFKKILHVTYRNSRIGRKYCFYYKIDNKHSYKLLFFLDRKPPCLFNAIFNGGNIEYKLLKKFGFKP